MEECFDKTFFDGLIKGREKYYAHVPPKGELRKPELLSEHSALTVAYARLIAKGNNLNPIIESLAKHTVCPSFNKNISKVIVDLFWKSIAFHDLGKLNENFQIMKMKNEHPFQKVRHSFKSDHSVISVYLYLAIFFAGFIKMDLSEEEQVFLCNVALYLSYPIYMHHHSRLHECQSKDNWDRDDFTSLRHYISLLNIDMTEDQIDSFHEHFLANANYDCLFDFFNSEITKKDYGFPLYALVKLDYSILTASDYLATSHYMNGWKKVNIDVGVITDDIRNKIIRNAHTSQPYNVEIFKSLNEREPLHDNTLNVCSNHNLNVLRRNLAVEVITGIRENLQKRLFYIEAPTGGGKTNASLLAMEELLSNDKTIKKVFYVFPFTTLITQTYSSVKRTLGLNEDEIAQIHSKAPLHERHDDSEDEHQYLNYLDDMFVNYPITLLSHIKFFDVLKTNDKDANYLLHRMANSIIIIDELQSYPPSIWDKIVYLISNYAKYFNMRFILMSATLPKIGKLIDHNDKEDDFVYLIRDKNSFFQNPNFCNRVSFDYSLLDWNRPENDEDKNDYLERLSKVVLSESEQYAVANGCYKGSVYTVIEFITKRTASEFMSIIKGENTFFDEIYILSGTILEPRRKEVISLIKNEENRRKRILLITTQVVEAGVDIDMDLGFKDMSIIDSEEQLAGRINRNVKKRNCKLFLFNCDSQKLLYGHDDRYKILKDLEETEYKAILVKKDFDRLYNIVIDKIKQQNKSNYISNMNDLYTAISTLDFDSVDNSFKIIAQKNLSVFVPLTLYKQQLGDIYVLAAGLGMAVDEAVDGRSVWNKFVDTIKNQDEDFVKSRILLKKMLSIISSFTFSIFLAGKDFETIKTYGTEQYGFFYLENYQDVYSYEEGINTSALQYSNFW